MSVTRLIRQGKLHGCTCGCRGDYHRPEECQVNLAITNLNLKLT